MEYGHKNFAQALVLGGSKRPGRVVTPLNFLLWGLYALSLSVSIAGMEILSWSLFVLALIWVITLVWRDPVRLRLWLRDLVLGPDILIWGFGLWMGLTALLNPPGHLTHSEVIGIFRWIPLLYGLSWTARQATTQQLKWVLALFFFSLIVASGWAVVQFFTGSQWPRIDRNVVQPYGDYFRATGFFSLSLTFAYSVGMGSLLALSVCLGSEAIGRGLKAIAFVAFWAGSVAVVVSLTRGAWLAYGLSMIALMIMMKGKKGFFASVICLALFSNFVFFNSGLKERFMTLFDRANQSSSTREAIWAANWEMFKDNPWLGVGLTRNSDLLLSYYEKLGFGEIEFVGHAHNNFLQMLSGGGIFGGLLYCLVIGAFLLISLRAYWRLRFTQWGGVVAGILIAQIYLQIGGLTECNFTDGEVLHALLFQWAWLLALSTREILEEPKSQLKW